MTVDSFTRLQFAWLNQDKGTISGLPDFTERLSEQYRILNAGNEKEGTELKCHIFALGLVTLIAAACGMGLLISQVEGGLYPAVCLIGISVGFVIGMVIAYHLSRNKQKMLEQTFDNYQKEGASFAQLLSSLEKSNEATIREVVDRLPEKKELIPKIIDHYEQIEKLNPAQLCLVSTLKFGRAIPLISETEEAALSQFLADYENKIFNLNQSPEELHDQLIARIYYLSKHPDWVQANPKIAKRYFDLFVNAGIQLDFFLDRLMQQHPTLLMPCKVIYQGTEATIPALRLFSLSPILADIFTECGYRINLDTAKIFTHEGDRFFKEVYKCSKETVPLFLDYLKYGKLGPIPFLERAHLAQCFQLDHLANTCDLSEANLLPTLKMAVEEKLYDIQWKILLYIVAHFEKAKDFKEPNARQLNQFIDNVCELREKSAPTLEYIPGVKKIRECTKFGRYFSTTPARRIWKINRPLSIMQLHWLSTQMDCEWDAITLINALEQCSLCLQEDNSVFVKIFLDCVRKRLENPPIETPFGYEFASEAGRKVAVFTFLKSMLAVYNHAYKTGTHDVRSGILKVLQAKKNTADIAVILKFVDRYPAWEWKCIAYELMSCQDSDTLRALYARNDLPKSMATCGLSCCTYQVSMKYQVTVDPSVIGDRYVTLGETGADMVQKQIETVQDLHRLVGITHLCATPEVWKAIGTQLDHLEKVTKEVIAKQ